MKYIKVFFEFSFSLVSNRGGSIYFTRTALNASNLVAALKETVTFLATNKGCGCSAMDLDQTQTTVSPRMRSGLMALPCYSGKHFCLTNKYLLLIF